MPRFEPGLCPYIHNHLLISTTKQIQSTHQGREIEREREREREIKKEKRERSRERERSRSREIKKERERKGEKKRKYIYIENKQPLLLLAQGCSISPAHTFFRADEVGFFYP